MSFVSRFLLVYVVFALTPLTIGQEANERSSDERASLVTQRDMNANLSALFRRLGDYKRAASFLEKALEIETAIHGAAHEELLVTLQSLAELSDLAKAWNESVKYRRRAYEMGRQLYANDDYRLRNLELALDETKQNALRTDQQREKLARAMALNQQVVALYQQDKQAEAIVLAKQVLVVYEEVLGKEHQHYAAGLFNIAAQCHSLGDYDQAEPLYLEAMAILRRLLGEKHPEYASMLNNVAGLYESMGRYGKAEKLFLEAKSVIEAVHGDKHPSYVVSLNFLAGLYELMGDYGRSEPLYLEAKAISENVLGKEHPSYALSLSKLASLYLGMGDYVRAEPLLVEAMAIRERTIGKRHPKYARTLHALAGLYKSIGDHARAEPLYIEALTTYEKAAGKEHPNYALLLNEVADLYQEKGDHVRAKPMYLEAKAILEKTIGKDHVDYASSLNHLATHYSEMGDYTRAMPLFIEAAKILEKHLGKEHRSYAAARNNVATICLSIRDYTRAESIYLETKTICENMLGNEHPDYAASLNNLAFLYKSMGDFARSEPLYLEAKSINEKVLGKNHRLYARSVNNLASLYESMGEYRRAEPLYLEAKSISRNMLGEEHPDYAVSLNNLAFLYKSMGKHAQAEPLFRESITLTLKHVEHTAYVQTYEEQVLMNRSLRHRLDNYLECCLDGELDPQNAIEQLVLWKGAILRRGRDLRLGAADPAIADQFRKLQSVASQLSFGFHAIPSPDKIDDWKKRLANLREQKQRLELELSARSRSFREALQPIRFEQIRDAIPADGILIDYLQYQRETGHQLVASLLRRQGDVRLVDLGSAEDAARAIADWREPWVTNTASTPKSHAAGESLRRQLWDPLREHLSPDEVILISTDGVLGRIPFGALPGTKPDTYLIEDYRLAIIPVPQLLPSLMSKQRRRDTPGKLLLVGDVDYGEDRTEKAWPKLSETGREIDSIKQLFSTTSAGDLKIRELRAGEATESAFRKAAPESRWLHLATHGFFALGQRSLALAASDSANARGMVRPRGRMSESERETTMSPGQRSGLVFAGANRIASETNGMNDGEFKEDGILTADEIAFLVLDSCDLAVLSACETGLGGEGLIGIQRAFQISGTRSTIATLWSIDDAVTRRMMEEFYKNYLNDGMSALDALREAQLWALNHPDDALSASASLDPSTSMNKKSSGETPRGVLRVVAPKAAGASGIDHRLSPLFWAPFVLSGDWR